MSAGSFERAAQGGSSRGGWTAYGGGGRASGALRARALHVGAALPVLLLRGRPAVVERRHARAHTPRGADRARSSER